MTSHVRLMNWVDFETAAREIDLVLMPFGAVEVYGPHLPMGADGIAATALCEGIAERVPAFIAPLIPVGYSKKLQDFPGTLSVRPSSLVEYARDIAESFVLWGARRFLFVNGHAGNVPYLNDLARDLQDQHGVKVAQIDWWRLIQPLVKDLETSDLLPHGHASEFGTSVMLHIVPEHVVVDRAIRTVPKTTDEWPDVLRPGSYRDQTDTGVVGDGTVGTAEKGAETLRRAVDRAVAFLASNQFTSP